MSKKWGVARGNRKIELSDDELMHWKYIKRVKGKNGKWRYYYDYESTEKGRRELSLRRNEDKFLRANNQLKKVNADKYRTKEELNEALKKHQDAEIDAKRSREALYSYMDNNKAKYIADSIIENIGKKTVNFLNNFSIKKTVQKGSNFVSNLFKKKDKGPNYTVKGSISYGGKRKTYTIEK